MPRQDVAFDEDDDEGSKILCRDMASTRDESSSALQKIEALLELFSKVTPCSDLI